MSTCDRNNTELSMHTKKSYETENISMSLMDYTNVIILYSLARYCVGEQKERVP